MKKRYKYPSSDLFLDQETTIDAIEITPNGKMLITLHYDGKIKLWDASKGVLKYLFSEMKNKNNYEMPFRYKNFEKKHKMLMSYDGSFVLIVGILPIDYMTIVDLKEKNIKKIPVKLFRKAKENSMLFPALSSMVLSPNSHVFLLSYNEQIEVFDYHRKRYLYTINWEDNKVNTLAINRKSYYFVIGSKEGNMALYSHAPRKKIYEISKGHHGAVQAVIFSKDSEHIISAGDDGCVKVWDFHTGDFLFNYYESKQKVSSLKMSKDGQLLIIVLEKSVIILNLESREEFIIEKAYQNLNYPLMTAITDNSLFLHSAQSGIEKYDIKSGILTNSFVKSIYNHYNLKSLKLSCGQQSFITNPILSISSDSRYVATVGNYQQIFIWDIEQLSLRKVYRENSNAIGKLSISPNNEYIISVSIDYFNEYENTIIDIYDFKSGILSYSFELESNYSDIVAVGVTEDNHYLRAIFSSGLLLKLDLEKLESVEERVIGCNEYLEVFSPIMSDDASLFIYGLVKVYPEKERLYVINIVDMETLETVNKIYYDLPMNLSTHNYNICLSSDNRYLDFFTENHQIFSWDGIEKEFVFQSLKKDFKSLNIHSSAIAPNRAYKTNIFLDEKAYGIAIFDFDKNKYSFQLIVTENENSIIIDFFKEEVLTNGEDEALLELVESKKFEGYERLELKGK